MLSGESAVGDYPVEAVEMLARIATEVEPAIQFVNYPPTHPDDAEAISEALHAIEDAIDLQCIVTFTETGYAAELASSERPRVPIVAYTPDPKVYRRLSLNWGVRPILLQEVQPDLNKLLNWMEADLLRRNFAAPGDKVLVMGGIPIGQAGVRTFSKFRRSPPRSK